MPHQHDKAILYNGDTAIDINLNDIEFILKMRVLMILQHQCLCTTVGLTKQDTFY